MREKVMNGSRRFRIGLLSFLVILFCMSFATFAEPAGTLKVSLNAKETTCTVKWSNYKMPSDGEALTLAVWSEANGQDDLKWRSFTLSSGVYTANFPISDHKSAGEYHAHLYLRTKTGKMVFLDRAVFTVSGASCSSVQVKNLDQSKGTCKIVISGLTSPSGITKVEIPTWCKSDQSDIVWYQASKQSDGSWTADVDFSKHSSHKGTYQFHVYATSSNKVFNFVAKTTAEYTGSSTPSPSGPVVKAELEGSICNVTATGLSATGGIQSVTVAVWSETDGQDDLKWTYATYDSSTGTATAKINTQEYCDFGTYNVHVYALSKTGKNTFQNKTTFDLPYPKVGKITATASGTAFTITISEISCTAGIDRVVVPVWSKADQSDIVWYTAKKQSNGTYTVNSDISKHQNSKSDYIIHVYIYDDRDSYNHLAGTATLSFKQTTPTPTPTATPKPTATPTPTATPKPTATPTPTATPKPTATPTPAPSTKDPVVTASISGATMNVGITNMNVPDGVQSVNVAVWSDEKGQDDLNWTYGTYNSKDNSATAKIDLNKHKDFGTYHVHVYALSKAGKLIFQEKTEVKLAAPTAGKVTTEVKGSSFTIRVSDISSATGVSKVVIPTWSASDQSDLVWYTATKQSDGSYTVTSDITKHKSNTGVYTAHVYVHDNRGSSGVCAAKTSFSFERTASDLTITPDQQYTKVTASVSDISVPETYAALVMAVWTEKNGQDDLKWYEAGPAASSVNVDIPLTNHKNEDGVYNLHLYARQSNGTMLIVRRYTFEVSRTNILMVEKTGEDTAIVRVKLDDASQAKAAKVEFPTWCASDQSDLCWYQATKQSDGYYQATISTAKNKNHSGTYVIHGYYNEANGTKHFIGSASVSLTDSGPADQAGTATITSCQITDGNQVTVKASVTGSGTFGLFVLKAGSNSIASGATPLATATGSGNITLKTALNANTSSSLINEKLVIGQRQNGSYVIVSSGAYITNPEAIASNTRAFPTASTKKGLQVNTTMIDDAAELGVKHSVINVVLNNIPCTSGGISYTYNGKTYHMDMGYVYSLDEIFSQQAANGCITSVVLLMQWDEQWKNLIIPSGRTAGYNFYGLNAEEQAAREQLAAIFSFLANRYSTSRYNVVNWILGNEVDDYTDYNWCGNISLQEYAADYAHAFRLLYNSVKSQYSNARVYISLDHVWNYPRTYGFKGMELFNAFVAELQREGDITWNIAFHPYPNPITSPTFWKNKEGVYNSSTSSIFTMYNLQYLTDYIKNTYGSQHRFILSETGFTSYSGGKHDEKLQAAAIAYGYYLAEFNDMVDSFVVHRHVDHLQEMNMGLYLGLWYNTNGYYELASTKKFSWTVFKYMDTAQGAAYTNFALPIIGADSWSSIVPGYTTSRFR